MYISQCKGWFKIPGYLLVCILTHTETLKQYHVVIYDAVFTTITDIIQPFFYFSCWNTCTQYVREATADLPSKAGDSFLSFFWLSGFPLTRHALFIAGAAKLAGILIIHIAGVEWVGLGRQSYVLNTLALSILRVLCLTLTSSALTVQWCLCQYNMLGRQI